MRDFAQQRNFRLFRRALPEDLFFSVPRLNRDPEWRNAAAFREMCELEDPLVLPDEKICFIRTRSNLPDPHRHGKWEIPQFDEEGRFSPGKTFRYVFRKGIKRLYHKIFHRPLRIAENAVWNFSNTTPNYDLLLHDGIESRLCRAREQLGTPCTFAEQRFLISLIESGQAIIDMAERYARAADVVGNREMAAILRKVPRHGAETFHEALQSLRFVTASFVLSGSYQIGFGRMDQYLEPFYREDLAKGRLTKEQAAELLTEFFISLNRDNDLCSIVQQGDDGLSLMLGGCKKDGSSAINDLTYMIMEVSRDLKLIDPKINLRIDSNTPEDLLQLGCELTQCGLGFPQYSNDEVIIPALVKMGYDLEDARDYTVAACWEFIIPGKECGVVNTGCLSFPAAVDQAFRTTMKSGKFTEEKLRKNIVANIDWQIRRILKYNHVLKAPSPLLSMFFDGCIEAKKDVVYSAKYRNRGIHGAGSANGADQLYAILETFKKSGFTGLKQLLDAETQNFEGMESYRKELQDDLPKVGNNIPEVDKELTFLFDAFAKCLEKYNKNGEHIRPGTGSAMFYIWLTGPQHDWLVEPVVEATSDGRKKGTPLGASLAPAQGIKVKGVLSVLKSFSNIDYSRIVNGGPITIELSHSIFSAPDGIPKLAKLLQYFVKLGNQQLQLNVLDAATLEDAVRHPENHRNLIVRVWGWSGYFCELAPEYQQHVINRHKYEL